MLLIVTGSGFYFSYSASRNAIEDTLRAELRAMGMMVARTTGTFMETAERDIRVFVNHGFVRQLIADTGEAAVNATLPRMKSFVDTYPYFDTIVIADTRGKIIIGSERSSIGVDVTGREYYQTALRGQTVFSEPTVSKVTNQAVIGIAVPVQLDGKVVAVAIATIPLQEFAARLIQNVTVGNTGYAYIVAQNGIVIAHPRPENMNKLQMNDFEWGKRIMQMSDEGFIEYEFNGSPRLVAVKNVPAVGARVAFAMELSEVSERTQGAVNASLIALVSVLVLIAAVLFFMVRSFVSRPLGVLSQAADAVAQGNLNVDMAGMVAIFANKGEITTTYTSIRQMLASLKENIELAEQKTLDAAHQTELAQQATAQADEARRQAERARADGMHSAAEELEGSTAVISSASEELSAQIEQSGRGAEEQAFRVTETATAMEEMNATVIEVAKSASSASEMSIMTKTKAQEGAKIVQDVVTSIREVQTQSVALKEDMDVLAELAQSINQIMRVISDIADQTNLLALNAAIEAARAGDAGRGFAVVADEVRKLAEKTMISTGDVGNAIKSIQQATNKNMQQVDSTVRTIEAATSLADKSGVVLVEIVGLADRTADQVHSIATASEEQSAASEEINRSISQVNVIASQTSTAMREASQAVGDLASQAMALQKLVEAMKNV